MEVNGKDMRVETSIIVCEELLSRSSNCNMDFIEISCTKNSISLYIELLWSYENNWESLRGRG